MNKIYNYKNGIVKVMYEETPYCKSYHEEWDIQRIKHNSQMILSSSLLGIELALNKGGRICYGMLCALVHPAEEMDNVKISISFTRENTIKFDKSILFDDEHVYRGLPLEYVEEIRKCICRVVTENEKYPHCDLTIGYAANCEVGSSSKFFEIITELLLNIICDGSMEKIDTMDICTFTNKYVKNIRLLY